MNNVKSFIMKRKLLLKMIFSYVAVGFILIGVFAYVIIDKVSDNLTEDVNQIVYNAMYGGSFTYIEMKQINTLLSEVRPSGANFQARA
ncbi:hypothetical protein ABEW34_11445 [Paenibacillus algorifonticola]|uniref:hypothetical protein n=1 Tax=Paenibacillus algorifonticola TaxID=684063 RepID=UPI003D27CA94